MITYNDIIIVTGTIMLFFQGFYFGRRQMLRLLIISLVILLTSVVSIIINGVYTLDFTIHEVIIAIIYVSFWWGLGYVVSHVVVIKEGDIGKVKMLKVKKVK